MFHKYIPEQRNTYHDAAILPRKICSLAFVQNHNIHQKPALPCALSRLLICSYLSENCFFQVCLRVQRSLFFIVWICPHFPPTRKPPSDFCVCMQLLAGSLQIYIAKWPTCSVFVKRREWGIQCLCLRLQTLIRRLLIHPYKSRVTCAPCFWIYKDLKFLFLLWCKEIGLCK